MTTTHTPGQVDHAALSLAMEETDCHDWDACGQLVHSYLKWVAASEPVRIRRARAKAHEMLEALRNLTLDPCNRFTCAGEEKCSRCRVRAIIAEIEGEK